MTYPGLAWTKTGPNRWERGIDEAEEFYHVIARAYKGSGRMFFGMTGFISFSVDLDSSESFSAAGRHVDDALLKAWLRLRYDHPTLASWVDYDHAGKRFRKIYESCQNGMRLNSWVQTTFRPIKSSLSGQEWANSDPPAPGMPTLFVLESTRASAQRSAVHREIIFRSPHEVIDGIGTLQLLNNLFKHASNAYAQGSSYQMPSFGDESTNLSPPLRVAASIHPPVTKEQEEHSEKILARNRSLLQDVELSILPYKVGERLPGVHKRVAILLSTQSTQRLTSACKSIGATVTHAYHAAIVLALRNLQPKQDQPRTVRYIGYCLINHRKDCSKPYDGPKHPVSVIHSSSGAGLVIDLPAPSSTICSNPSSNQQEEFKHVVAKMRDYYVAVRHDTEHLSRVPKLWALGTPKLSEDALTGETPAVPPPDPNPSVSVSSMGRIDDIIAHEHGPFRLNDPWITGEELRTGLGTFLGTWKGQLTFSATYNDAWHNEEEVLGLLRECERIAFQGLEIEKSD